MEKQGPNNLCCPSCGSKSSLTIKDSSWHSFWDFYRNEPCYVKLRRTRFLCGNWEKTFSTETVIADHAHVTDRFVQYLVDTLFTQTELSFSELGRRFGLSHNIVSTAAQIYADRLFGTLGEAGFYQHLVLIKFQYSREGEKGCLFGIDGGETHIIAFFNSYDAENIRSVMKRRVNMPSMVRDVIFDYSQPGIAKAIFDVCPCAYIGVSIRTLIEEMESHLTFKRSLDYDGVMEAIDSFKRMYQQMKGMTVTTDQELSSMLLGWWNHLDSSTRRMLVSMERLVKNDYDLVYAAAKFPSRDKEAASVR